MSRHQRRAVYWALAAVVALVLWWTHAFESGRTTSVQRVSIVTTSRALAAGARIRPGDLLVRRVAYSAGLAHDLTRPSQLIGLRMAVAAPAGTALTAPELARSTSALGSEDVAVKLDADAGIPAGDLVGARADLVVTIPGRDPLTRVVLANVTVVGTDRSAGTAVATLRLPPRMVVAAIRAEAAGDLRLVAHTGGEGE